MTRRILKRWSTGGVICLAWLLMMSAVASAAEPAPDAQEAWREALARTAAEAHADNRMVIPGQDGWLFFGPSLRHLAAGPFWGQRASEVSRASNPAWADPLPAIVDFDRQLRDAGIKLILVPVPVKPAIYPDHLPVAIAQSAADVQTNPAAATFYDMLRKRGIEVLDLTSLFRDPAEDAGPHGAWYCRQDTHWSGAACVRTAKHLAARLKDESWYGDVPEQSFIARWSDETITGDLYKMLDDPSLPREKLPLRFVQHDDGTPVKPNRDSPVLLLGDSHTLVFHSGGDMHAVGAGLVEQLTYELGFAPDLVGVRGSGATPSRIALLHRGDNLAGKKVVIWVFSAREFTQGQGWRKVPVIR